MAVDKEKIAERISDIQSSIGKIEKYADMDEREFLLSDEKIAAAKYHLIAIIEGCFSICTHIAAKEMHKAPDGYAACFKMLAESKVLPEPLSGNLAKMTGFRNLLIHRYWEIEDKKVYQYLKTEIVNIREYLKIVAERYLR